jgi:photosystem II stability/assembly factor-like uncharacterized protein
LVTQIRGAWARPAFAILSRRLDGLGGRRDRIAHHRWGAELVADRKLEYSLDEVVFADPFNGWGISQYPVRLYRTMDGGDTWSSLPDDWKSRAIEQSRAKSGRRL